ncbi:uncharacterized protein TNCV_1910971 [Trichonephila clavipes]|nr:uncharacterized protein TNCV_1910971 [Trichonephila clavipes]
MGSSQRPQKTHTAGAVHVKSVEFQTSSHWSTLHSHRAASPLVRLVEGEERWEAPDHPRVFSLKIGVKASLFVLSPVWCSKLRITTGITQQFAVMNFVGLDLAFSDQYLLHTGPVLNARQRAKASISSSKSHSLQNGLWAITIMSRCLDSQSCPAVHQKSATALSRGHFSKYEAFA